MTSEIDLQRLGAALAKLDSGKYELTLFVSGASTASARAISDARAICDVHLRGHHDLTIVDVNQQPDLVRSGLLATPTLIKESPVPERMVVGDLSDSERVLLALDVSIVGVPGAEHSS